VFLRTTVEGRTNGSHLRQTNASRTFADASGATNWTVASSAGGVSDFRMVVDRESLYTDDGIGLSELLEDSFTHYVTDGTASWELHAYENTDGEVAFSPLVDGEERTPCEVDAVTVEMDLSAGTVDGAPCPSLTVAEGLDGDVDLEYRDADRIAGTYELRVDDPVDPATDGRYAEPGEGSLSATSNLYSATVRAACADADRELRIVRRLVTGDETHRG
jgi:hypothetical protein